MIKKNERNKERITITINGEMLGKIDQMVEENPFLLQNRSHCMDILLANALSDNKLFIATFPDKTTFLTDVKKLFKKEKVIKEEKAKE